MRAQLTTGVLGKRLTARVICKLGVSLCPKESVLVERSSFSTRNCLSLIGGEKLKVKKVC
jgi:hypothetical protein